MPVNKSDFFYIAAGNYDDIAELSLPNYREGHALISQILREGYPAASRALDLGTGSGETVLSIIRSSPQARITCVDAFPEMLELARRQLAGFLDRLDLVLSDLLAYCETTEARFDVVTAGFCIHHLESTDKQRLFVAIARILSPGGVFLMFDHMCFKQAVLKTIGRRTTEHFLMAHLADEMIRREWLAHWHDFNRPDSSDDMVRGLQEAGLSAETVCRWQEVGLIAAFKP
jgi:ubiquinone/menaquinone biosynthesis C-methylase UbiE